jgi:hypothetical protein
MSHATTRRVHRLSVTCVLAACSGTAADVAKDASKPRDAALVADAMIVADAAIDARVEPVMACRASPHHLMGKIEVSADLATLRGELIAYDASKAASRHLRVRAKPSPDETVFVFEGYADGDSEFKGKPVPRTDHLKPGDVVARLLRARGQVRLVFDGAFRLSPDFDRGKWTEGYSCK